ncbi:MAG: hypothetical protein IJZ59_02990 [Alphaproteobacteria bacterium]|nr:hypothetical protein [Alphaproteobacteria bacterium]
MQIVDVPSATTPNPYLWEEEPNFIEKGISLIQDGVTAFKYYKEMDETNKKLINMYGKEAFDFVRKNNRPWTEVSADAIKDLTNNRYGSKVGHSNREANCRDLLGHLRTRNMIDAGIK